MSSLIRRSLRTTAATAGIAAVGLGLAGPAFAAPELLPVPQVPDAGGVEADESRETRQVGESVDRAPVAPGAPLTEAFVIPGVVFFEMPTVNMATSELPAGDVFALPAAPALPGAPTAPAAPAEPAAPAAPAEAEAPAASGIDDAVGFDAADAVELQTDQVQGGPSTGSFSEGQNNVGALQSLDMAALAIQMAQNVAAGDSVTEHQQIG